MDATLFRVDRIVESFPGQAAKSAANPGLRDGAPLFRQNCRSSCFFSMFFIFFYDAQVLADQMF